MSMTTKKGEFNTKNSQSKPEQRGDDANVEIALRPSQWEDYVGQSQVKTNLRLMIDAARGRNESCDHLLFYGQPGLGKTTLAFLIGKEMNTNTRPTSGPALEKIADIAAILSNLEPNEILFIDEAHRINKSVEEVLYPAMESRKLHLVIGKGASARTFSLDLPPFTVIAATTKVNLLSSPLRSRFGATFRLDYYTPEDVERIITRSAAILKCKITKEAVKMLANASRFTPRVANRLLKRARDYNQIHGTGELDKSVVEKTLSLLNIDHLGLEGVDRELLTTLVKKFNGGPVGVRALGSTLGEDAGTVEDVYEPFLIQLGLLHRTPLGRIATRATYEHLGMPVKTTLL